MFFCLILLFTVLPAAELIILLRLGQAFGLTNALILIIGTGIIGAYIARIQGFRVLQRIQNELNQGIMPAEDMINGLLILCGGITLLTPGLITDILGFMLIIPLTRNIIKKLLKNTIQRKIHTHNNIFTVSGALEEEDVKEDIF